MEKANNAKKPGRQLIRDIRSHRTGPIFLPVSGFFCALEMNVCVQPRRAKQLSRS
jgi:hypothetical protein